MINTLVVMLVSDVVGLVVFSSRVFSSKKNEHFSTTSLSVAVHQRVDPNLLKYWKGCCGDGGRRSPTPIGTRERSPDPVGTLGSDGGRNRSPFQVGNRIFAAHHSTDRGHL